MIESAACSPSPQAFRCAPTAWCTAASQPPIRRARPRIALHGGYPRGKRYLLKKLATDLTGLTAWKTYSYFFGAPAANAATQIALRPLDDTAPRCAGQPCRIATRSRGAGRPAARHRGCIRLERAAEVPRALGAAGAHRAASDLRLRAIFEHGRRPATIATARGAYHPRGPFLRLALFPHHVNYHVEHHLFPRYPLPPAAAARGACRTRGAAGRRGAHPLQTWRRVYAPARPA